MLGTYNNYCYCKFLLQDDKLIKQHGGVIKITLVMRESGCEGVKTV